MPANGLKWSTNEISALTQLSGAYHSELVRIFAGENKCEDPMETRAWTPLARNRPRPTSKPRRGQG